MFYLTIGDLRLIVDDLVANRWALLSRFTAAIIYGPALKSRLTELTALEKRLSKRPLAAQLKSTDETYDLFGRAIYHLHLALSSLPLLSEPQRELMAKTGALFMPSLAIISRPYQEEADAAKQSRSKLDELAVDLRAFPIGASVTLYDIVAAFVDAGVRIDNLLRERADTTSAAVAPEAIGANRLRTSTMALLGRLRETVDDEIAVNPDLTAKMSAELFTYMDQLNAMRAAQASKPAAATAENPTADPPENPPANPPAPPAAP